MKKIVRNLKLFWDNFKRRQLLVRILITILLITIFRVAATITVPGVKLNASSNQSNLAFLGIMDLLGGGGITRFSIVALGVSPYITASIIVQLLTNDAIPALSKLAKSGEAGRRKINIITRWLTIAFAIMQAFALAAAMVNDVTGRFTFVPILGDSTISKYIFVVIILLAGCTFTLFLGERITEKGVGNGTSLIIFSGIAASLPTKFKFAYESMVGTHLNKAIFIGVVDFIGYCLFYVAIFAIILFVYLAERRIPIQQTGKAMTSSKDKMAFLPIKLNPAGVIPVIFASAILSIPLTIAQFLPKWWDSAIWIKSNLSFVAPIGLTTYITFVVLFTLFWSQVQTNPDQISENFQKSGTFIPGVRPGEETRKYLTGVLLRLSIFSSVYLGLLAGLPYIEQLLGMQSNITIGGTGMIILVSVGIDTIKNVSSRRATINLSKIKRNSQINIKDKNNEKGLLW